jgi:hypothetical protein
VRWCEPLLPPSTVGGKKKSGRKSVTNRNMLIVEKAVPEKE